MIEAMMPNIDRVGQKSLGKTRGREIGNWKEELSWL
jgi:hypothetical protein